MCKHRANRAPAEELALEPVHQLDQQRVGRVLPRKTIGLARYSPVGGAALQLVERDDR
jgi:hypothetical protein